MSSSIQPPEDHVILGDYRLESHMASGGMGEIWRARHVNTGRPVALKRLKYRGGEVLPGSLRARLVREARALERLRHDNIVSYIDSGFDVDGQPYLAMEWLDGESLGDRNSRSPLDLNLVLDIVKQSLTGLICCHEQDIVHRDIKPENLFLVPSDDGVQVKLLDLGLALIDDGTTRLTRAGDLLGTLYYLSPEQARGSMDVDHRADLYAMGVLLYELTTRELPFTGDQPATILLKIITETPVPPRRIRPEIPAWLERVILRAMSRAPSGRYSSAGEMLQALDARDLGEPAADDATPQVDAFAQTGAYSVSSASLEVRQVCLLCAKPISPGIEIAPTSVRAMEQAGGIVHQLLGGEVVGLFGLDQTLGDEALRAMRAGMQIREAHGQQVRLLASTIHFRVGEGLQFNSEDLDLTLEKLIRVPPGELVLDLPTRHLIGDHIVTRRVGGRDTVVSVASEAPVRRRVLGMETPTVGRETELAAIRAAYSRSFDNEEPEAVLVLGRAGMGKSRLLQEILPELREQCTLFLEAQADRARSRSPYGLLADAVARVAGVHVGQDQASKHRAIDSLVGPYLFGPERQETVSLLEEVVGVPYDETLVDQVPLSDPKVMRERIARTFEKLLEAAGKEGPVCLCLEDLHWADQESLRLCELLLERLEETPLFLLASSRPSLLEDHPRIFEVVEATRVELPPLGRRPLRRLLRAMLGRDTAREVEAIITRWSDGNPYFAEELLSWMVTRGVLVQEEQGWRLEGDPAALELPAGVEGAIQARLDQLPAEPKNLLKVASVFGEVFWHSGCVALGFPEADHQLRQLEAAEFVTRQKESRITGTREWRFRHALLHQVANNMLPPEATPPLHLKVAHWLEEMGENDAALLARHFELGKEIQRAAEYYARAGARAYADGDLALAVECYESSLHQGAAPRERVRRVMGMARAMVHLGRYDDAWQTLEQISEPTEEASSSRTRAEILFMKGRISLGRGQFQEGEAVLSEAMAVLSETPDADLDFEVRHTLFWTIWVQGRYGDAGEVARVLLANALESGRADYLCSARLAMAYFNAVEGDLHTAVTLARQAVHDAREIRHPYREVDSLVLLGSAYEHVGQYEQAHSSYSEAQTLALRLKTLHHQASVEACLGRVNLFMERMAASLEHFHNAIEKAESLGDHRTLGIALVGKAEALWRRRNEPVLSGAEETATRALELSMDRIPSVEADARFVLARICLAMDKKDEAVTHAFEAVKVLERLGTHETYEIEILLTAHDALMAVDREDEATQMLRRAQHMLQKRADRISDEEVRNSFMQKVPHNRRARELCQEAGLHDDQV